MRRADLLVGLGLLVLAGVYFEQSFAITRGFASDRLGPAFFPRLLALTLAALGATLVVRGVAGRAGPPHPPPAPRRGGQGAQNRRRPEPDQQPPPPHRRSYWITPISFM